MIRSIRSSTALKTKITGNEENAKIWLNEFVDFEHSVEMLERLLREKKINVDKEYGRVRSENLEKGYYLTTAAKKGNKKRRNCRFLDVLKKEILLADGAMETYLRTKVHDAVAQEIHDQYVKT